MFIIDIVKKKWVSLWQAGIFGNSKNLQKQAVRVKDLIELIKGTLK